MDNKKKKLMIVAISLFSIAMVSFGTYALWNSELLTGNNSISSGQVKMSYTESNEIGMDNALPIKDEEGKVLTNYFDFQVLSYIKTKVNDNTERKINYKVVLEPITVDNPLSDNEIKVYLTKVENGNETVVVEPTTIDQISNYILSSQDEVFSNNKAEVITSYRLRAWIDSKVDTNKLSEKKYSYKFRVNVNSGNITSEKPNLDTSGANAPELTSNMIPVYYDEASSEWKKADSNNTKDANKWYDYDNKMWANAVTVTNTNRETYLNADAGTTIPMSDINTMWVWVPRYTYTYLNTNTPQEINVKFESGTASTGTIKCTDAVTGISSTSETCTDTTNNGLKAGTSTYTHPAFWWDKNDNNVREENEELTGIWVGKFEVSSDTSCTPSDYVAVGSGCNLQTIRPQIKPNVTSWRGAQVGTFFNGIQKMRESGNKYGFATTDETHMMKNMEWGVVAYLSHSKYGINKEVAINSSGIFTTGCGPQSAGSTSYGATCNSYTTTLGQSASTAGNVYGVYDMSGGAYEYMMGNMVYINDQQMSGYQTSNNYNSAFTGILYDSGTSFTGTYAFPSKKYYDKYSYGTNNTDYTRGKLGDATKEMTPTVTEGNWYADKADFVKSKYPWVLRGGDYYSGASAGAFYFNSSNGNADTYFSARAVISNLN
mgnify:CR=1 FL=1